MSVKPPPRFRFSRFFAPGARQIAIPLGLLLALWFLSSFTAFRTDLEFTSQAGRVSLTINRRSIQAVAKIDRVSKIQIEAPDSVFPMGGKTLKVVQNERIILEDRLPGRFSVKRGAHAPLGDWYVDPAGRGRVYERSVRLTGDFTLEATFTGRCTSYTSIVLQGEPNVSILFRRGLLNNDFLINAGGRTLAVDALVSPRSQLALNALDILVRSAMAGCLLVLVFAALRRLFSLGADHPAPRPARPVPSPLRRIWVGISVGFLVLIALGIRLWVSRGVLEGLAHTPDEVAYMLQAKWLLANKLYQAAPPIQEYLAVPFTYFRDQKWFSIYPVGWPLVLALGQAIGLPWIVSPICGALYVLLLFLIGQELYGELVGLTAALLGALSPMAILMFSSYLSHGSAALMIALFLWLFLVGRRRESLPILGLSGASLGFAFGIRPLTAAAVACPFAILLLSELLRSEEKRVTLRSLGVFILGGVFGSLPVLISNRLITGSAFSFAYSYGAGTSFSVQNFPSALMHLDATVASVPPAIFGWGWGILTGWPILSLSLAFACVPFLLRGPRVFDLLFAAMFIALPLSFLAWGGHGLHGYGPRFYFEALFGIYLLTARGFFLLGGIDASQSPARLRWGRSVAIVAGSLLIGLVVTTAVTLRPRMRLYKGYNWVNGGLETAIGGGRLRRGLILFPDDNWFSWGAASNLLQADLQADLAFAVSRPDNSKLLAFYPNRRIFMWERDHFVRPPVESVFSKAPTPAQVPNQPAAKLTTLLGWWLALSAAGAGLLAALARGRLSQTTGTGRAAERARKPD